MITGEDFLAVADVLGESSGEAFVRSRIGRLYYAVYLEARQYCEAHLGHSRERLARAHQVIAALLRSLDPELEMELRLLRRARNEADYEDQLPARYIDDLLERSVLSSSRILERLTQLKRDM